MTANTSLRFDIEALKELAGDKVFARGQAYHRGGHVEILANDAQRVLAQVVGSEDYRTVLTGRGTKIGGECSCPAFEDWGFCKHMVAVALAANAAGGETDDGDVRSRIRDHLTARGAAALAELILDLAERDAALFRKLDMAAAITSSDDKTLAARLRKAIDGATQVRDFIDYRAAPGWAADVDTALDALADIASGPRAELALTLAGRAIDRIQAAFESIDDSDGYCGGLLHRARDIHVAAAEATGPEPLQLARDLFAREMADDYGAFDGAAALYADVLGEKGLAEYRRLAVEAWEALSPGAGEATKQSEFDGDETRLQEILDFFAERDGDVDVRIALRARDLSSPWRYLQLAEFCRSQGRAVEALRRAEEGLWVFEDARPDEGLVLFTAALLTEVGRKKDAEAHLRRAFETAPSLGLYAPLRELGGKAVADYAAKFLEDRLGQTREAGGYAADLLVHILIRESMFDQAWAAVGKHPASTGMKEALARASEATHPRRALAIYAEHVDQLANGGGGNPAYEAAAALIRHMAVLRSASEQAGYVAELKVRFGRKRNFLKLLG